ncbi:hypothetical protein D4764_0152390, partial [Takifugu flavidus]
RKETEEEGKFLTKGKDNLLCNQGPSSLLRPLLNIIDCPAVFHCRVCCLKLRVEVGFNYFQTVDWSHWDSHKPRIKTIDVSSVLILPSELLYRGVRHSWNDDDREVHICIPTTDEAANLQLEKKKPEGAPQLRGPSPWDGQMCICISHLYSVWR